MSKGKASANRVRGRLVDGNNHFAPDIQKMLRWPRVQRVTLTVPPALRWRYYPDPDLWSRHVGAWIAWAKAEIGFLWGWCRTHPTGDDLTEFAPHAEILFHQHKGFHGRLPVEAMRVAWAETIGAETVDLHVQFYDLNSEKQWRRFCQAVRYIERPFPGWSWRGAWGRWYEKKKGLYPRGDFAVHLGHTCPQCGQRIIVTFDVPDDVIDVALDATWSGRAPPHFPLALVGPPP